MVKAGRVGMAVLAASATVLAACGSGSSHRSSPTTPSAPAPSTPSSTGATPTVSRLHWTACHGAAGPKGFQCATLTVPRDPAHPGGATIGLALDRHPATGTKIGSLLVNPGGPGASGVDALPQLVGEMPSDVTSHFDVVGFDPPGVARSAPITCLSNADLAQYFHVDPAPTTPAGFNALLAESRTFADGCESRSGAELPYVSTVDAARDMDLIRQAVGDAKLTYFGFSYGTLLGATYADLFPTHVRAMVLDGAEDPALPTLTFLDQQSAAIESDLHQFFAWCATSSTCAWKPGPDPTAAFENLLAQVRNQELPARGTSRTVGPSEVLYGTAAALYSTDTWSDLGVALALAAQGDGTGLLALFDAYTERSSSGTYSNEFEANAAVNALDRPPLSLAQINADVPIAEAAAPIYGLQNLYSEVSFVVWPVPATGRIGPIRAVGSPPIVVVGSTGDPITPYAWAEALASELANGVLLTRIGDGHTGYGASSCIRNRVDAYLVSLTVPPAGLRCPSN